MKKFLNILLLAGIAASLVVSSGCSEVDEPTDPGTTDPTSTTCYMTQEVSSDDFDSETTSYLWNDNNQLIRAIEDGDTTILDYQDGKLIAAYGGSSRADLVYGNGGTIPSRINIKEDGEDVGHTLLTETDGNITYAEFYDTESGSDVLSQKVTISYDETNNVSSFKVEIYDEDLNTFTTFLEGSNIQNDGKKNPYRESFAFVWLNIDNPVALGASNVTSAQVAIATQNFPYVANYTYNDNDYPLTSKVTFFIGNTDLTYTYNCK